MIPSKEECCVECQEQNPFFKVGGSLVGQFAYTRETPFIQPFETIESPWADFIKSDSMETNIKKLLKLAQKYRKETAEEKTKEEEAEKAHLGEQKEVKPKPRQKTSREERPKPRSSARGKEKVIVLDDPEEKQGETGGALTRAQFESYQSRWKSINASSRISKVEKQEILLMSARLGILTESKRGFQNVDQNLYRKLNERFGTNFAPKKSGLRMKR